VRRIRLAALPPRLRTPTPHHVVRRQLAECFKDALVDSPVSLAVLVDVILAEGHTDTARSGRLHQAVVPPVLVEHPLGYGLLLVSRRSHVSSNSREAQCPE